MKYETIDNQRSGIQVIARAAAILRLLKSNPDGLRLSEIAPLVQLARSTVQRIIAALQAEHFVIADASGRRFRLGPEIGALAAATQYNVVEQCRDLITELSQKTGETSDLSVMRGSKMIFLDQVPGSHRLRTVSSIGEAFPLTTTANGKACLARLPIDQVKPIVQLEWENRQIDGDIDAFVRGLNEIKATGLAYDIGDHSEGISAIGISFVDLTGDLLSISVPVPSSRFESTREIVETSIRETARQVYELMDSTNN
ncbi:MAG: IclR family transcriptional regulator [Hyphomicrobiales bacterium]